MYLNLKLLTR